MQYSQERTYDDATDDDDDNDSAIWFGDWQFFKCGHTPIAFGTINRQAWQPLPFLWQCCSLAT
jgi:hypothetical protein